MKKSRCAGCYNDIYNYEGANPSGTKKCFLLKDAKIVWRKKVHIKQVPPWEQKAERYPNCYHKPGYVFVGAKVRY